MSSAPACRLVSRMLLSGMTRRSRDRNGCARRPSMPGKRSSVMWSCATRSTKRNGPAQTGWVPKSLPAASVGFRRHHHAGAIGQDRRRTARTAASAPRARSGGSTISTWSMRDLAAAEAAAGGQVAFQRVFDRGGIELSPSWNNTSWAEKDQQRLGVGPFVGGGEHGTMFSWASKSNSLSHSAVITTVPT